MSAGARWQRFSVPVAAVDVVVAMLGLVWTGIQQVSVSRGQAAATAVAIEVRLRNELVEGARRFEEARHASNKALSKFEANNLLFRIEAYQRDLERLGVVEGWIRLAVGVLRQSTSGFCGPEESAGRHINDKGFPVAGALADKFDLKTSGWPCPKG